MDTTYVLQMFKFTVQLIVMAQIQPMYDRCLDSLFSVSSGIDTAYVSQMFRFTV